MTAPFRRIGYALVLVSFIALSLTTGTTFLYNTCEEGCLASLVTAPFLEEVDNEFTHTDAMPEATPLYAGSTAFTLSDITGMVQRTSMYALWAAVSLLVVLEFFDPYHIRKARYIRRSFQLKVKRRA
jgi:hypothetical protein